MKNSYTGLQNFFYQASFAMTALRLRFLWLTLLILAEVVFWRVIFIYDPNSLHLLGIGINTILNLIIIVIVLILAIGTILGMLMDTFLGGD